MNNKPVKLCKIWKVSVNIKDHKYSVSNTIYKITLHFPAQTFSHYTSSLQFVIKMNGKEPTYNQ
jgi:hypothetical protein